MKLQRKEISFEIKSMSDTESGMIFHAYAATFNDIDSYGDAITKGAFDNSIAKTKSGEWPALLGQHGGMHMTARDLMPLGIVTDLYEDERGLVYVGKLASTRDGEDYYKLMKMEPRPAIAKSSIGYYPVKWKAGEGAGQPERILQEIDLIEISLVTFPANPNAVVTDVKSIEELQSLRDIERHMRDAWGASNGEAKALISKMKAATLREAEAESKQADLLAALQRNLDILRG